MAAVPFDFIDQTSLLGDRDRIAEGFALLAASRSHDLLPWCRTATRSEEKLNATHCGGRGVEPFRSSVASLTRQRRR